MNGIVPALAALLLGVPAALAAPGPKAGDAPPLYFPTTVGATAVREQTTGKLVGETTDTVTEVTKTADGVRVTVERTSKSGLRPVKYQTDVSAKGLAQVRFGPREFDPPTPLLKLPAKAGDTWEWEDRADEVRGPRKIKFRVVGEEEVEVPAGKFKSIRVAEEEEVRGRTSKHESWYAPDVGLVKRVTQLVVGEGVIVLKSFTPGKR
jgi:hypothetical protein